MTYSYTGCPAGALGAPAVDNPVLPGRLPASRSCRMPPALPAPLLRDRKMMGLLGLGSVSDYITKHAPCNVLVHKSRPAS